MAEVLRPITGTRHTPPESSAPRMALTQTSTLHALKPLPGPTVACPQCDLSIAHRSGSSYGGVRRWTCARCGMAFDADGPLADATGKTPDFEERSQLAFGARVRDLRQRRRTSLRSLASLAGINWVYLSQVERGERNPSLVTILRLGVALGIEPDLLVRGMGSLESAETVMKEERSSD